MTAWFRAPTATLMSQGSMARTIFTSSAYRGIILRTVGMAAAVTVVDGAVAFPFAYFMARIASPRTRTGLSFPSRKNRNRSLTAAARTSRWRRSSR